MDELSPVASFFPLGSEWIPWEVWHPPAVVIQVTHDCLLWPEVIAKTMGPEDFHWFDAMPYYVRKGLFWRLTGIGKQQIEGLDR